MMFSSNPKTSAVAKVGGLFFLLSLVGTILGSPQLSNALPRANLAQQQLSPVSPDESVTETLDERFSLSNALGRLNQTRGALSSFVRLTERNRNAIAGIDNTDWETQNLGFVNWTGAIEGTLRHQDYQLKKLELELARKQYADGEISQATLQDKQTAYQRAEREFQTFWHSFGIGE